MVDMLINNNSQSIFRHSPDFCYSRYLHICRLPGNIGI